MDKNAFKKALYRTCTALIDHRLEVLQQSLAHQQQALLTETKSSAGDKHETGRAMVQLEMEKTGRQILECQQMRRSMEKLDLSFSPVIRLGSVVQTNQANYFVACGIGKIEADNQVYYAISPKAPVGAILLGKTAKETILFRGNTLQIEAVF